jgi:hypothetical protein
MLNYHWKPSSTWDAVSAWGAVSMLFLAHDCYHSKTAAGMAAEVVVGTTSGMAAEMAAEMVAGTASGMASGKVSEVVISLPSSSELPM